MAAEPGTNFEPGTDTGMPWTEPEMAFEKDQDEIPKDADFDPMTTKRVDEEEGQGVPDESPEKTEPIFGFELKEEQAALIIDNEGVDLVIPKMTSTQLVPVHVMLITTVGILLKMKNQAFISYLIDAWDKLCAKMPTVDDGTDQTQGDSEPNENTEG